MKNKLGDLNNHLFAALERLSDEDMTAEQIEQEAKRASAIVAVAPKKMFASCSSDVRMIRFHG